MSRQSIIHVCLFFAAWLFSPLWPDYNLSKAVSSMRRFPIGNICAGKVSQPDL